MPLESRTQAMPLRFRQWPAPWTRQSRGNSRMALPTAKVSTPEMSPTTSKSMPRVDATRSWKVRVGSWVDRSAGGLAHVAVFVLLAAAAGARIVAAHLLLAIANRLRLLPLACVRHPLLTRVLRRHPRRRLVDRRPDRPDRLLETLRLLHAEDSVRHAIVDAVPHRVELLHALPLVLRLRVDLAHPHHAHRLTQVVHRIQVVFPGRVELVQQEAPLHAPHLGPVTHVEGAPHLVAGLLPGRADQPLLLHVQVQMRLRPCRQLARVLCLRSIRVCKRLVELIVNLALLDRRVVLAADPQ